MLLAEPTSGAVWNANRGAISLRVRVLGKSAHVSLQHQGENAFERMVQHASERGANAVIGIRYDATEIMQGVTEVLAYGTAVVVEKSAD